MAKTRRLFRKKTSRKKKSYRSKLSFPNLLGFLTFGLFNKTKKRAVRPVNKLATRLSKFRTGQFSRRKQKRGGS